MSPVCAPPVAGPRAVAGRGWGLALGGGGSVGIAYLSGVLTGLADHGVDLDSAGLVVGTSAGAIAAAALRAGLGPEAIISFSEAPEDPLASVTGRAPRHYEPAWSGRVDLCRRLVGAGGVVTRSMLRIPGYHLDDLLPAGLYRPRSDALRTDLGDEWPERPLWLIAQDLRTGRRVAVGSEPEDRLHPLHRAVMASCSVPGLYEPVRLGRRRLVDGGVVSSTSIDLAVRHGCRRVLAVLPMGCESGRLPVAHRPFRSPAIRRTRQELRRLGQRARDVLVIQPHREDLALHGANIMRAVGNDRVSERARERTHDLLRRVDVHDFFEGLTAEAVAR